MPVPATFMRPNLGLPRRWPKVPLLAACLALVGALAVAPAATAQTASSPAVPKLDHVFVIMEENNGFADVIGNPAAPNLNYLANTFGLETDYFSLSQDSSETNYVGLLGGNVFNVTNDDAYWKNSLNTAEPDKPAR